MPSTNLSLHDELHQYNRRCDSWLRSRYGMSFRTFKVVKATTQLIGVVAGIYAMTLGADPLAALGIIALIYTGPEAAEYLISQGSEP